MTFVEPTTAQALDEILCRWHAWQQRDTVGRGYNRRALVCGDYRISRQYDDENGALDDSIESDIMRTVDFQVQQMKDPHRAAIYALARALVVGARVWTSPRLPQDRMERIECVAMARTLLTNRLRSAGVMC